MEIYFILLTFAIIFFVSFILLRINGFKELGFLFKMLTSSLVVCIGIYLSFISSESLPVLLIAFGASFGLLGDCLLELKVIYPETKKFYLQTGFIMFIVGHIFYIVSIMVLFKGNNVLIYSFISLIVSVIFSFILIKTSPRMKINYSDYKLISFIYGTILSYGVLISIFLFSSSNVYLIILIGYVLFALSDLVLCTEYFGNKDDSKAYAVVNHLLYYAAQLLIVSASLVYLF